MPLKLAVVLVAAAATVFLTAAQQAPSHPPLAVELAIPFGSVPGKLLLLGNYMVFLDEQQPELSVVVPKSAIARLAAEGATIIVNTTEPLRLRSTELRALNFRISAGGDAAVATAWYGSGATAATTASSGSAGSAGAAGTAVYQARHNHRIGDCKGRLLIGPDQVSFESIDEVSHSRRWNYSAIKETRLSNPYELQLTPFSGGSYKLYLDGSGMDPTAYKNLVDRVVGARTRSDNR
jgi:hypothetical protein